MNLAVILIFAAPAITMRLLAGEEQDGTIEFLLTSPITIPQLILGKYLASLGLFLVIIVLTFIFPGILLNISTPDKGVLLATYIGFFLLIATYLAVGVLCSSLTSSQVIASISSFGILLLLDHKLAFRNISGMLGKFACTLPFQNTMEIFTGIIDTAHIVYFFSIILAALIFTMLSVDRRTKYKKLSYTLIVIITIGAVIGANLTATRFHHRWDLTQAKRFSLSQKPRRL